MFRVTKAQESIDALIQWAMEGQEEGSHYPGMSYEQGIMDTLDWLEGHAPRPDKDE